MPLLTKKKKLEPLKPLPHDPENRHLSKAQLVAKRIKQEGVNKKIDEYKKKLLAGDEVEPESKGEIEVMEAELKVLVDEAAKAEAMADSVESEKKAKELKKKVQSLRMKIGKAKKKVK